jgi:hypothetical protein
LFHYNTNNRFPDYLIETRVFFGHPPHADGPSDAGQLRVVGGEERVFVEGGATAATVVVLPVAADHRLVFPGLKLTAEIE